MVGGIVKETIVLDERIWVNVQGTGCEKNDICGIYLEKSKNTLLVGKSDKIWWQGLYAYWTSPSLGNVDTKLKRAGSSGIKRPEIKQASLEDEK